MAFDSVLVVAVLVVCPTRGFARDEHSHCDCDCSCHSWENEHHHRYSPGGAGPSENGPNVPTDSRQDLSTKEKRVRVRPRTNRTRTFCHVCREALLVLDVSLSYHIIPLSEYENVGTKDKRTRKIFCVVTQHLLFLFVWSLRAREYVSLAY